MTPRLICDIAADIRADWRNVHYTAVPYLAAMRQLGKITDSYGPHESAQSIVMYFLSNASTWRGPVAKAIKAELKALAFPRHQHKAGEKQ